MNKNKLLALIVLTSASTALADDPTASAVAYGAYTLAQDAYMNSLPAVSGGSTYVDVRQTYATAAYYNAQIEASTIATQREMEKINKRLRGIK